MRTLAASGICGGGLVHAPQFEQSLALVLVVVFVLVLGFSGQIEDEDEDENDYSVSQDDRRYNRPAGVKSSGEFRLWNNSISSVATSNGFTNPASRLACTKCCRLKSWLRSWLAASAAHSRG